ncbi:MAG: GGDEF domain-containing protein [Lachnospiraceae bacterium]|nr:GGDEF domain-containing protein [Lachnospiraceae bacterium]
MPNEKEKRSYGHRSLTVRLPLLFVSNLILIILIIIPITYNRFHDNMVSMYTRMAEGLTELMAHEIDPEKVDLYLNENFKLDEYNTIMSRFYDLKDNYPDVMYIYVYHFEKEGGRVIFDLESDDGEAAGEPGSIYQYDEAFKPYISELMSGLEIPVTMGMTPDGYLLTYVRPILKENGEYACHVCVDFSMDALYKKNVKFIHSVFFLILLGAVILLIYDILVIKQSITGPIKRMIDCTRDFRYETEDDRVKNVQSIEELQINSKNELGELYRVFVMTMKESMYYMTNLSRARRDIKVKDEKIGQIRKTAYSDALTGVGNKTAYNNEIEKLNSLEKIGLPEEYGIVMIDINNLKYVNDTFGHNMGDSYIKGCCKLVCEVYKHSPVFRIGGDEFVVVLEKKDFADRGELFEIISKQFEESYADAEKDPWDRYSASIGMAVHEDGDDAEAVVKRADERMYAAKLEFKKVNGSYR